MNSSLLNIWREIGAYLRYGDAKCIFISSLSFGALFSFLRFRLLDSGLTWDAIGRLMNSDLDAPSLLAISAFLLAFFISTNAVLPSISKSLWRVKFINWIGSYMALRGSRKSDRDVIFFVDIARHSSALDYEVVLRKSMELENEFNAAEKNLIEQIWIISKIASAKFVAANISIVSILIGSLVAFC